METIHNELIKFLNQSQQSQEYIPPKDIYLSTLCDIDLLIEAFNKIKKCNGWKTKTQQFQIKLLKNVTIMHNNILNLKYKVNNGGKFFLNEGGKIRVIKTLELKDMIFQHVLNDNILLPELKKYIMYDNGASLKDKGISFTRRRFEKHLKRFIKQHNTNGYILFIDFRRFFDNIHHDKIKRFYHEKINNQYIDFYLNEIFKHYEVDMSYYESYDIDDVFNSVEHESLTRNYKSNNPIYMQKSLGVGSPISQLSGLLYPFFIDTYVKIIKQQKLYGAYMDDRYLIHHDKNFLKQILSEIKEIAKCYGIHINEKKTKIVKLTREFTFLKTRYIIKNKKIIRKIPKSTLKREKQKVKKLANLVKNGKLTFSDFRVCYMGWIGDKSWYNSYKEIQRVNKVYQDVKNDLIQDGKNIIDSAYDLESLSLYIKWRGDRKFAPLDKFYKKKKKRFEKLELIYKLFNV